MIHSFNFNLGLFNCGSIHRLKGRYQLTLNTNTKTMKVWCMHIYYCALRFRIWTLSLYCFVLICFACFPGSHNRVNQCPVNEHGCLDLDVCIHMSKLCDGVPDCSDGWDEGPHCRGNKHTEACTHPHTFANLHLEQIPSTVSLSPLSYIDKSVSLWCGS